MNILVVGSGGREHALVWKLAQSPRAKKLFAAPGNGGTCALAENIPIAATDIANLLRFAKEKNIGMTIVGPDDPLALGIVDAFRAAGLPIFGPTKLAARIETSKAFAKMFMGFYDVPTAPYRTFIDPEEARAFVQAHPLPVVIKADGLARGKGVFVCKTREDALIALEKLMGSGAKKTSPSAVVIEGWVQGSEISLHAFSDGKMSSAMPISMDHKRLLDLNRGPNTGGMGAVAPIPWILPETAARMNARIIDPILRGLSLELDPFVGCLYPGVMLTENGPIVLEYNARFGDPETQCLMRLLKTDLIDICEACIHGELQNTAIAWSNAYAACVVLASVGYPDTYKNDVPIKGIAHAERVPGVTVFHAGTKRIGGRFHTAGGRVLGVTAVGDSLEIAIQQAYKGISRISFPGMQYRRDIGFRAIYPELTS